MLLCLLGLIVSVTPLQLPFLRKRELGDPGIRTLRMEYLGAIEERNDTSERGKHARTLFWVHSLVFLCFAFSGMSSKKKQEAGFVSSSVVRGSGPGATEAPVLRLPALGGGEWPRMPGSPPPDVSTGRQRHHMERGALVGGRPAGRGLRGGAGLQGGHRGAEGQWGQEEGLGGRPPAGLPLRTGARWL